MQERIARNFKARKIDSSIFHDGKSQPRSISRITPDVQMYSSRASPSIELPSDEREWITQQEKQHSYKSLNKFEDLNKFLDDDDNSDIQNTLENGRVSKLEYQKFKIIESGVALLATASTVFVIFASDLDFTGVDPGLLSLLLWVSVLLTLLTIMLTVFRYLQKIKYLKGRALLSQKDNLFTSGEISNLVTETGLLLLQPYPFFNGIQIMIDDVEHDNYFYSLNELLALFVVVRLYLVIRMLLNKTKYRTPQARRVAVMYGAENDYLYAAKCIMKDSPLRNVLLSFCVSIFIFGYMVRIAERPLARNLTDSPDFRNYLNGMWCVVVTMTTVGYGDVYPRTSLGRFIIIGVCIWGVFIVSLMVVSLNNILTMSSVEEKSLTVLKRLSLRKKLAHQAAHILTNVAKISINNKKSETKEQAKLKNRRNVLQIRKHLTSFRKSSRKMRSISNNGGIVEEMHRRFDMLGDIVHDVATKQENLEKSLKILSGKIMSNGKDKKVVSINCLTPILTTKSDVNTNTSLKGLE